jgi:hypothetical protein
LRYIALMLPEENPLEPAEDDARGWRELARRRKSMLRDREEEIAWLRDALKRKEAVAAGEPLPTIVKARPPKKRW